jgi:hypothetical protein
MGRPFGSDEIRETFLQFFTQREHARIDAASIVPANDPTRRAADHLWSSLWAVYNQ